MGKKPSKSGKQAPATRKEAPPKAPTPRAGNIPGFPVAWLVAVVALAAVVFFSMLQNGLTNWDDEFYVVKNMLLRGPDWAGIFSKPVVSNYHPLTIATLAFNYHYSELMPFSYHLLNFLLHLANTGLVFYLAWLLSGRIKWVALVTAAVFAVHPMHVESVAWISERKDVLYTLFYLLSMIAWWAYLQSGKNSRYVLSLLWFILSLLSKPAAIVLPLSLLLLDYWHGRGWTRKTLLEKIPFFALAAGFAVLTLKIQSVKAIADAELYPLWERFLFGFYGLMMYLVKFFVPFKLSAFHPFPAIQGLNWTYYIAPLVVLALAGGLYYFRRNKALVFGALFFVANLLLVLQVLSFGNAVIAERYTYVPYIGLAFGLAMFWQQTESAAVKTALAGLFAAGILAFSVVSFQRIGVWKNSETLWTDVLEKYPGHPLACGNRAIYYLLEKKTDAALRDAETGLKTKPTHFVCLESKITALFYKNDQRSALEPANTLVANNPNSARALVLRGYAYRGVDSTDLALRDFTRALELEPNYDEAHGQMGTLLFNKKRKYPEALAEFTKAIEIKPLGNYFLNRSRCHYMLGNKAKALEDVQRAIGLKEPGAEEFLKTVEQLK